MFKYTGCLLQVVGAGAIAGLLQSVLLWFVGQSGFFTLLQLPLNFDFNLIWFYQRISWGGFWGLVLLLPFRRDWSHFSRGMVLSIFPALASLLYFLPSKDGHGYFGLNLGVMMPVVVVVFNIIWGMIAGRLCDLARPHRD